MLEHPASGSIGREFIRDELKVWDMRKSFWYWLDHLSCHFIEGLKITTRADEQMNGGGKIEK